MATDRVADPVSDLLYRYVRCIDDDRLEEWPDYFVDDCLYKIVPRETARGNDEGVPIVYCNNKKMLRDRIAILRNALVYNLHYDRHIVSNVCVDRPNDGLISMTANFVVFQTNLEGETTVFCSGKYDDDVTYVGDEPKFKNKTVTIDTYAIPNMISTPL